MYYLKMYIVWKILNNDEWYINKCVWVKNLDDKENEIQFVQKLVKVTVVSLNKRK